MYIIIYYLFKSNIANKLNAVIFEHSLPPFRSGSFRIPAEKNPSAAVRPALGQLELEQHVYFLELLLSV